MIIPPLWLGIYSYYEIVILSYMGLIDIGCPSDALLSSYRRFKIRCGDLRDSLLNHINKPSSNHVIIRLIEDLFKCPNNVFTCHDVQNFSFPVQISVLKSHNDYQVIKGNQTEIAETIDFSRVLTLYWRVRVSLSPYKKCRKRLL